ncbi:MAG: hypothetical protein V3T88_01530 [Nitrosomonadaceae bacterium]
MGIVNIEWINANRGANVSLKGPQFSLDVLPISFADTAFQSMTTTSSADDSDAAPTGTTHALLTSVSGSHYARKTTDPATGTGGMAIMSGSSRLIPIEAGIVFKIVTTA